jgi:hypothetical protein
MSFEITGTTLFGTRMYCMVDLLAYDVLYGIFWPRIPGIITIFIIGTRITARYPITEIGSQ